MELSKKKNCTIIFPNKEGVSVFWTMFTRANFIKKRRSEYSFDDW